MKLKRIKAGKRNRWKKGHSCASNPGNSRFREAAKGAFFEDLNNKPNKSELTVEALAEHAAALSFEPKLCVNREDDISIGKSFNTFATNFSNCTIPAFEKFFRNFAFDSDLQTRMLAIHAAAQEYIQEAKLTESSTSYMCALMASLEGIKDTEEDVGATLSLITKVIRKVQKEILKAKFGEYSKTFDEILTTYSNCANTKLIINAIGCLSILLRAQNEIQWTYSSTMNLFQKIVFYTTHENVDIRKTAQYNVSAILKASSFILEDQMQDVGEQKCGDENKDEMETEEKSEDPQLKTFKRVHPAAPSVGKFIITNLKITSQDMNGKATLYLLTFLQQVIITFPEKVLEQCCARVLGVMYIGDSTVRSRSLKVFGTLFTVDGKEKSVGALTEKTNESLVNALISTSKMKDSQSLGLVPGINDEDLNAIWMDTVASGIVCLVKLNELSGIQQFSSWIEQLTVFWKSESKTVHEKTWHTIDFLMDECIKPLSERVSSYTSYILAAFHQIEKFLSLQNEEAWPYVFRSLVPFFQILGPLCSSDMVACLKNLSSMVDNPEIVGKKDLENAIGAAISGMGPEEVMKVIPLQITGNIKVDENHFWILPVLRKHVKNSRLCFFESYFVHLASKCFILLDGLKKKNQFDSLIGKTYQQIERQIWALFPSFTNGAVDIKKALSIQSFAKLICDHIKFREDTRVDIMTALRNLLRSSDSKEKLAFYGKNYLPALFNLYLMKPHNRASINSESNTIDPGQRLAAFTTIQTYLPILSSSRVLEFFNLIFNKFEKEENDLLKKKSLLNLARSFIPYLDKLSLNVIFEKTEKDIKVSKSVMQKVAYRVLEDILTIDSKECKVFVEENFEIIFPLLLKASKDLTPNSRASRLKCLMKLLSHLPKFVSTSKCDPILEKVVIEAVQFCGIKYSISTRKAAFALLLEIGFYIQKTRKLSSEDTFHYCFALLPSLNPPGELTANIILAKIALSYQYKDLIAPTILKKTIEEIGNLLQSGDKEIVKSSLSFIRMTISVHSVTVLSGVIEFIVQSIIEMPEIKRQKFRMKIRDILSSMIRKFGDRPIKALIPKENKLHKVVTNLAKKDSRHKRLKNLTKDENEEEEEIVAAPTSLEEVLLEIDKEMENDKEVKQLKKPNLKTKKKPQTWIKEDEDNIIDLLDLSLGGKVTTEKPRSKEVRFEERTPLTDEEKYGFKMDRKTSKFIITEKPDPKEEKSDKDEDYMAFEDVSDLVPKPQTEFTKPILKRKRRLSEDSEVTHVDSVKYGTTGSSQDRKARVKNNFDYGSEFRAKNAKGDVVKKGGVAPYAYVELSKDKLNRRKKAKYAGQFKSLVKGANKGAAKGRKIKNKNR